MMVASAFSLVLLTPSHAYLMIPEKNNFSLVVFGLSSAGQLAKLSLVRWFSKAIVFLFMLLWTACFCSWKSEGFGRDWSSSRDDQTASDFCLTEPENSRCLCIPYISSRKSLGSPKTPPFKEKKTTTPAAIHPQNPQIAQQMSNSPGYCPVAPLISSRGHTFSALASDQLGSWPVGR